MSRPIPTHDRISILQDPILCHILSFLSTKFAGHTLKEMEQTMALSSHSHLRRRSFPKLHHLL